ncbi:MAG: SH3 domain-containing protein [Geminicoccaceae bacterium]|nr:SH3 domain-containing protein [Geminicoccaceae bacterium]
MRLASVASLVALLAAGSAWAASGDPLVVTGDGVNVRSGPSTDNRIVLRVYRNREVVEIAREGDWVRVEIAGSGGQEGWIHSSLLAAPEGDQMRPAEALAATARDETEAPATDAGVEVQAPSQQAAEQAAAPEAEAEPRDVSEPVPDREETVAAARPAPDAGLVEPAAGPAANQAEVNRFRESVSYLNSRALQVAGVDLFTEVEAVDQQTVAVGITEAWQTVPPAGQRSYLNTLVDRWSAANGGESPVNVRIIDPRGHVLVEQTGP